MDGRKNQNPRFPRKPKNRLDTSLKKFEKTHRKEPVLESVFFNNVGGLRPVTLLKRFLRTPFL